MTQDEQTRNHGRGRPPKVSVIIPTFNRAEFLPRAVRSVLAQGFADFELIVVDDHSEDDTPSALAQFTDPRIRSVRRACNGGQSRALNAGIALARGEYLAFLDDDDEWLPHKLASQVPLLDAAPPQVGLVYGWRRVVDDARRHRSRVVRPTMRGDIFENVLAFRMPTPPSSWLVRASLVQAVNGFDEALPVSKDCDFVGRICQRGAHVDYVSSVVMVKHRHARGQLTDHTRTNLAGRADQLRGHCARFSTELAERPAALASVYLYLATYELPVSGLAGGWLPFATAFRLDPVRTVARLLGSRTLLRRLARAILDASLPGASRARRLRAAHQTRRVRTGG